MTDIILGMGEVGETLFDLLVDRKFDCVGIDLDNTKCKKYHHYIIGYFLYSRIPLINSYVESLCRCAQEEG